MCTLGLLSLGLLEGSWERQQVEKHFLCVSRENFMASKVEECLLLKLQNS